MKKFLPFFLFILLVPQVCWAVAATELTGTCYDADPYSNIKKCYYESSTSVTSATDVVFKINVPSNMGQLLTAFFDSSSTDCDIFFSEKDLQTVDSIYTIASVSGINLWDLVAFDSAFYRNQDTTSTNYLYVTVANDDAGNATGSWKLYLTIKPQQ